MKPLSITVEDWHSRSFSSYRGDIRLTLSSVLKGNKDFIIELLTTINMWHFVILFFFLLYLYKNSLVSYSCSCVLAVRVKHWFYELSSLNLSIFNDHNIVDFKGKAFFFCN